MRISPPRLPNPARPRAWQDLPIFVLLGVMGGLAGAAFNAISHRITILRTKRVHTNRARFTEAVVMALLTAISAFALVYVLPLCESEDRHHHPDGAPPTALPPPSSPPMPPPPGGGDDFSLPELNRLQREMNRAVCAAGEESQTVRLLLDTHEGAIKSLFHAEEPMDAAAVVVLFFYSFVLAVLTYGIAVPSGLFVPAILTGASIGRLVGEMLQLTDYAIGRPGDYALVGAAAMLGGVCRMTISITVIVLESTTNVYYVLPIALTIMTSKLVGDAFNEGIYDLHMRLKKYPTLPDEPPREREGLLARHIMATDVKTVCELEQVGTLLKLLRATTHHGFPVVARGGGGAPGAGTGAGTHSRVLGVILRDQLITILVHRRFESRRPASPHLGSYFQQHTGPNSQQPPLSADDFRTRFPAACPSTPRRALPHSPPRVPDCLSPCRG